MSEAPERIWAMAPHIGEFYADPPVNDEDKRFLTEYVRADLLPVVKPLVWRLVEESTSFARCRYVADTFIIEHRLHGEHFDLFLRPSATAATRFDTLEAAKDAAQADYERRIRACLDMIDPAELVAGAYEAGFKDFMEMKLIGTPQDDPALSMLRALTGTEAQDALDAAIAKAVNAKLDEAVSKILAEAEAYRGMGFLASAQALNIIAGDVLAMKGEE